MILPVSFLWQQLNGPQVTAIKEAVFEYWKSIFDDKLDYFNNISIESVNNEHLTLIGLLSGLVRPTISEADREYFYFTEEPEPGNSHGFSSLDNLSLGGRVTRVDVGQGVHNVSLNEEHYRALLRAFVNGQGELGSLELLDDVCAELTKLDLGDTEPFYKFVFMHGDDIPPGRAEGDVFLNMGNISDWHNPMHVYAVLRGIADSIYAPQPQLYISIATTGACAIPEASPKGDTYQDSVDVELTCDTEGAQIYYTLDGTEPSAESTLYENVLHIEQSCVLKAIAVRENYGNSKVLTQVYVIE